MLVKPCKTCGLDMIFEKRRGMDYWTNIKKYCSHACRLKAIHGVGHPRWKENGISYNAMVRWRDRNSRKQGRCQACEALGKTGWYHPERDSATRESSRWMELCIVCMRGGGASPIGLKIGRLTVLAKMNRRKCRAFLYRCRCECGTITEATISEVRRGDKKSCGCLRKDAAKKLPRGAGGFRQLIARYKSNARIRGIPWRLSDAQFKVLATGRCVYCGSSGAQDSRVKSEWSSFRYTGVDRVDPSGKYTVKNCVPCCKVCNVMKSDMTEAEFLAHVRRIAKNRR